MPRRWPAVTLRSFPPSAASSPITRTLPSAAFVGPPNRSRMLGCRPSRTSGHVPRALNPSRFTPTERPQVRGAEHRPEGRRAGRRVRPPSPATPEGCPGPPPPTASSSGRPPLPARPPRVRNSPLHLNRNFADRPDPKQEVPVRRERHRHVLQCPSWPLMASTRPWACRRAAQHVSLLSATSRSPVFGRQPRVGAGSPAASAKRSRPSRCSRSGRRGPPGPAAPHEPGGRPPARCGQVDGADHAAGAIELDPRSACRTPRTQEDGVSSRPGPPGSFKAGAASSRPAELLIRPRRLPLISVSAA